MHYSEWAIKDLKTAIDDANLRIANETKVRDAMQHALDYKKRQAEEEATRAAPQEKANAA